LSWAFYGWWDWRFVGLLGASTLVNQALVVLLDRQTGGRRRLLLAYAGSLACVLGDTLASELGAQAVSIETALADKSIDAVAICSSTDTHSDLITRAGFPPVHLAEINFQAMYEQQQAQQAAAPQQ
jgi:hypothetical protein